MNPVFRRVTTGVNDAGKSYVAEDLSLSGTAKGAIEVWHGRHAPAAAGDEGGDSPYRFYPPPCDSIVRIVPLPPVTGPMSLADLARAADDFFESQQIPECRIDTSRHPFMHRTPTIDYVILLSGRVELLLDVGEPVMLQPMEMVVQRMTNHTWINSGSETAILLVVMIGVAQ